MLPLAIAGASFALQAGQSIMQAQAAGKAAKQQQRQQDTEMWAQIADRFRAIEYAEEQYARDMSFARETLDYAQAEFSRQTKTVERGRETIQRNTSDEVSAVLARQIEEDMALILGARETSRAATGNRATLRAQAGDRGVEGNSVEAIIQDVSRQEGDALNVQAMNRSASDRMLTRQAITTRAQGTQQMMGMGVQTMAPQSQVRVAAPMASIVQQAPVARPNTTLQMAMGIGNAAVGAFNSYNRLAGPSDQRPSRPSVPASGEQASGWLSRTFRIGG